MFAASPASRIASDRVPSRPAPKTPRKRFRSPTASRTVLAAMFLPVVLLAAPGIGPLARFDPGLAAAQRRFATIDSLRHIQSVKPRLGPIGTTVEIYTENLPPQAEIHVGVGAMRAGFEALAQGTQQMWGEVSATVRIPDYVTRERPIVFIIFNGRFSPVGISHPFHVTDDDGLVQRSGRITDEGMDCVTMRDGDQYLYALSGDLDALRPGDEVTVVGAISVEGPCGGADSIAVVELTRR